MVYMAMAGYHGNNGFVAESQGFDVFQNGRSAPACPGIDQHEIAQIQKVDTAIFRGSELRRADQINPSMNLPKVVHNYDPSLSSGWVGWRKSGQAFGSRSYREE
jgi:hypothetical protein